MDEFLLFFDTFEHEKKGEDHLDCVLFKDIVVIKEIRIVPFGFAVESQLSDEPRLGATDPAMFDISFFGMKDMTPHVCPLLAKMRYDERNRETSVCIDTILPLSRLVFRGRYNTITLAVFGRPCNEQNVPTGLVVAPPQQQQQQQQQQNPFPVLQSQPSLLPSIASTVNNSTGASIFMTRPPTNVMQSTPPSNCLLNFPSPGNMTGTFSNKRTLGGHPAGASNFRPFVPSGNFLPSTSIPPPSNVRVSSTSSFVSSNQPPPLAQQQHQHQQHQSSVSFPNDFTSAPPPLSLPQQTSASFSTSFTHSANNSFSAAAASQRISPMTKSTTVTTSMRSSSEMTSSSQYTVTTNTITHKSSSTTTPTTTISNNNNNNNTTQQQQHHNNNKSIKEDEDVLSALYEDGEIHDYERISSTEEFSDFDVGSDEEDGTTTLSSNNNIKNHHSLLTNNKTTNSTFDFTTTSTTGNVLLDDDFKLPFPMDELIPSGQWKMEPLRLIKNENELKNLLNYEHFLSYPMPQHSLLLVEMERQQKKLSENETINDNNNCMEEEDNSSDMPESTQKLLDLITIYSHGAQPHDSQWVMALEELEKHLLPGLAYLYLVDPSSSQAVIHTLVQWCLEGLDLHAAMNHRENTYILRHIKAGLSLCGQLCNLDVSTLKALLHWKPIHNDVLVVDNDNNADNEEVEETNDNPLITTTTTSAASAGSTSNRSSASSLSSHVQLALLELLRMPLLSTPVKLTIVRVLDLSIRFHDGLKTFVTPLIIMDKSHRSPYQQLTDLLLLAGAVGDEKMIYQYNLHHLYVMLVVVF